MITKEEMENVTASVSINIIVINIINIVILIIIAMGPKYTKADIWWILRRK